MINVSDVNTIVHRRSLRLGVTLKAKIGVSLDQHLRIDGTMRIVANGAAFAHCRVLEDDWPGLLPVTLGAALVQACHRQPTRWFHNVHPVRIVALDAIHFALNDGMMLWEMEFRPGFRMTLETSFGIFP